LVNGDGGTDFRAKGKEIGEEGKKNSRVHVPESKKFELVPEHAPQLQTIWERTQKREEKKGRKGGQPYALGALNQERKPTPIEKLCTLDVIDRCSEPN